MFRTISFFSLLTFYLFLATAFLNSTSPIQKIGITNAQWKETPAGILVWGKTANGGIQIDLYDHDLKSIATYSYPMQNSPVYAMELFYCGKSYCEFILHAKAKKPVVFLRLYYLLGPAVYPSDEFPEAINDTIFYFTPQHLASTIANYRDDREEWEIRTDSVGDANRTALPKTFVRMNKEVRGDNFPIFQQQWKYELTPSIPEYAKFLFRDKDRIYFYVNFKTETGEQYLYCMKISDGTLIYKTKLSLNGKQDWVKDWDTKIAKTQACIYSNFYNDSIHHRLFIAGTCLLAPEANKTRGSSGTFLLELDDAGKITGAFGEDAYYLIYPEQREKDGTSSEVPRNLQTYFRFSSMSFHSDGSFSSVIEPYSLQTKNTKRKDMFSPVEMLDSNYHYLLLENMWYDVSPTSIKPYCADCIVKVIPYSNNPHLDSVNGFVAKETKLIDRHYANDINELNDPDVGDHYYVGSFFNDSTKSTKVLMKDSVQSPNGNNEIYFEKNVLSTRTKNCLAIQNMVPVAGQNMKTHSQFLVRDEKTLFKLTTTNSSYTLEVVSW
jgi:hypothetical protein